ncbi:putative nucleic acid-binding protein [Dioscorea sansibarensis]
MEANWALRCGFPGPDFNFQMAANAWYGPLIDLSDAASHLDDFVQLIVFVHRSQPIQKSSGSSKGKLLKTDIQVGDNTRSYFSISIWQKHLWSMIVAGDIIFLQNVKIVKFRDILEASTVQVTGVQVLINYYKFTTTKANNEIEANCSLGERTREKLRRVVEWVRLTESATLHLQPVNAKCQPVKNWKSHEEKELHKCLLVSELPYLSNSSSANFYAWINEISFPSTGRHGAIENGQFFHSGRLTMLSDFKAEDLICTGCKLCGCPLDSRYILEEGRIPLDCMENSKYLHDVCFIYRPFLLHVRDDTGRIPLLVKNKAAEVLFGGISAENVYKCYMEEKNNEVPHHEHKSAQTENQRNRRMPNFYRIVLIMMKLLMQKDNNSPFLFEIIVDVNQISKFELVSLTMPCYT